MPEERWIALASLASSPVVVRFERSRFPANPNVTKLERSCDAATHNPGTYSAVMEEHQGCLSIGSDSFFCRVKYNSFVANRGEGSGEILMSRAPSQVISFGVRPAKLSTSIFFPVKKVKTRKVSVLTHRATVD